MKDPRDIYQDEIEELTGKIFKGDLTPLVYDLFKDSNDIEGLIKYLTGEIIEKEKEDEVVKPVAAPRFEDWFRSCKQIR